MKSLLNLLLNQSLKDLFKYKSFFFLMFVLILVDRLLKILTKSGKPVIDLPHFSALSSQLAVYLFNDLPGVLFNLLTDLRTIGVIVLLFLLKQLISMWPSSDMRRMHRQERERFGLIASLVAIHGRQIVWDALAVGATVGITGLWVAIAFLLGLLSWQANPSVFALVLFGLLASLILPITMAGFSFSSKLAVIGNGSFKEKLVLFFQLLSNPRLFGAAWLFFSLRLLIEGIFVVILPLAILWSVESAVLRIALAGIIATPFYSFLKMASFKFFLYIYQPYPLVKTEYQAYYQAGLSIIANDD